MADHSQRPRGRARGRTTRSASSDSAEESTPHARPQGLQGAFAVHDDNMTAARSAGRAVPRVTTFAMEPVRAQLQGVKLECAEDVVRSAGRGVTRGRRVEREEIRTRPAHVENTKKGNTGTVVKLSANYFKLLTVTNWCLYQYHVDFAPDEDRTHIRKNLLAIHKNVLGGYIFDGSTMFTSHRLVKEPLELFSQAKDGSQVRITLRKVGDLAKGDYQYLQFFNILMRKCLNHLKLQLVGRNYFDPHCKYDMSKHNLELWPGYITSIRQHENDILLCAEVSHKVMRQDTVLQVLEDCMKNFQSNYKEKFKSIIVGCIVLTDYNNRTYRVDDVDFSQSPRSTFKKENENVSYADYYEKAYEIRLRNMNQPLLVTRTKPRERRAGMGEFLHLIPELCRMTGLDDEMRTNYRLMRDLADHTRVGPDARIQKLLDFCKRLMGESQIKSDLDEWNMKLAENLVEFNGRILPHETIIQGKNPSNVDIRYDAGAEADWTRNFRRHPMLVIAPVKTWVVLIPYRVKSEAQSFIGAVRTSAQEMSFILPPAITVEVREEGSGPYVEVLEHVINTKMPDLVMCIVTTNRIDRYAAIKKKCYVDHAIPSQVIVSRNLTAKGVMSIAMKVAVQLNCKVGGAPWALDIPLSDLMVVGFDVCHDTTSKGKSYGAIVASLNRALTRYHSGVAAHTSGEELSNSLVANLATAIRRYQEINGKLPGRILIYRDGVGDGQIPYVHDHEVMLLRNKLQEMYGNTPLRMAFIVVTKRINTRIFFNSRNPPPGTVVDDVITLPQRYDFFLVSQCVRQGTVSPTSYNVISDDLNLDPDKIQRLTYKLTHMYFNWSGTVRVPAPCQYAHKLAYLIGQAIHRSPNQGLEDLLYYL